MEAVLAYIAVGLLAGCGGGEDKWTQERPKPVPAGGTVLYKNEPVEGATVTFVPTGTAQAAIGQTDASGKFQLQTYQPGDGAVPGDYKVTVRKVEVAAQASEETNVFDTKPIEERSLLPQRYGKAEKTDLTASVKEEAENGFTFELKD
jgi:hypothetical protein